MMLSRPLMNALAQVEEILNVVLALPAADQKCFYADRGAGRHVRHIFDPILALQEGIDSGVLDYNHRNRESVIERDPTAAKRQLADLQRWLEAQEDLGGEITIVSEVDFDRKLDQTLPSSVERELLYIIDHTIHHAAHIRLMGEHMGLDFPEHIGLAPATATYLRG